MVAPQPKLSGLNYERRCPRANNKPMRSVAVVVLEGKCLATPPNPPSFCPPRACSASLSKEMISPGFFPFSLLSRPLLPPPNPQKQKGALAERSHARLGQGRFVDA